MGRVITLALSFLLCAITSLPASGEDNLLSQSHAIYKLDDEKLTDFMIAFVNYDVLTKPDARYVVEIVLSLAPVGRDSSFECDRFYKTIGKEQEIIVRERMKDYLFVCSDGKFTENSALKRFSGVLKDTIEKDYEVDATWAWFSATGNTEALKRFIDNYLYNEKACHACIERSYSSNYRQNTDVYKYLKKYSMTMTKNPQDKIKLFRLAPKINE